MCSLTLLYPSTVAVTCHREIVFILPQGGRPVQTCDSVIDINRTPVSIGG